MGTYAELDLRREEIDTLVCEQRALHECRCDDALLPVQAAQQRVRELGSGIRHGEGSTSCAILSLHDLIATVLDAVHDLLVRLAGDGFAVGCLGEEGDDGGPAVSADDGHGGVVRGGIGYTAEETRSADDVEGGDTEQVGGVEDTCFFEGGGDDGDGGVDGVGDDEDVGGGCYAGDGCREVADNRCVGL